MKKITAKSALRAFWAVYPESEQYLRNWYSVVKSSEWKNPNDVKITYSNVSILKGNRIVFNIKGNSFRLVAKINFEKQWVFIRFVGTHEQYDKINADNI